MKVGDRVRSFDFDNRDVKGARACYAEGVLEAIGEEELEGCRRYRIRVEKRVFGGKVLSAENSEKVVFPPVNGTPTIFGETTDFVVAV